MPYSYDFGSFFIFNQILNLNKPIIIKTIAILIMVISLISCGTVKTINTPGEMSDEVVTNNTQDENYVKAYEWMVENFNDAESVIQSTDKESGIIKGKYLMGTVSTNTGTSSVPVLNSENLYAIITLRVKD